MKHLRLSIKSSIMRQSIRSALAVTFAVIINHFVSPQFPYWITMTTIILMQTNIGASITKSYQRVIGTIFGLLAGLMLVMFFNQQVYLLYILFPLLIFLFSYLRSFSYNNYVFILSMLIGLAFSYLYPDPWSFVFWRIIDTLVAVGISIAAAIIFFPAWAKDDFNTSLATGLEACQNLFNELINGLSSGKEDLSDFLAKIINIENMLLQRRIHYTNLTHEPGSIITAEGAIYAIIMAQERMHSLLLSLRVIYYNRQQIEINEDLRTALEELTTVATNTANALVQTIKKSTQPPAFINLNKSLETVKKNILLQKKQDITSLLYRNLVSYTNELKHIAYDIKQLRPSAI